MEGAIREQGRQLLRLVAEERDSPEADPVPAAHAEEAVLYEVLGVPPRRHERERDATGEDEVAAAGERRRPDHGDRQQRKMVEAPREHERGQGREGEHERSSASGGRGARQPVDGQHDQERAQHLVQRVGLVHHERRIEPDQGSGDRGRGDAAGEAAGDQHGQPRGGRSHPHVQQVKEFGVCRTDRLDQHRVECVPKGRLRMQVPEALESTLPQVRGREVLPEPVPGAGAEVVPDRDAARDVESGDRGVDERGRARERAEPRGLRHQDEGAGFEYGSNMRSIWPI